MSLVQVHMINGVEVTPPKNYEDIDVELNFGRDEVDRSVSISSFEWIDKVAADLKAKFESGLSGGVGVFEGIPHKIILQNGTSSLVLLDGYIDMTSAQFDQDLVTADSVPARDIDWLNDVADGFTFEYLEAKGIITTSDYHFVPYVVASVPAYKETFIAILTLVFVGTELNALITDIGGSSIETGSVIDTLGGAITLIGKLVYAIALVATIVNLILDMIALIIGFVKYKPCMLLNDLMEKGAQYLGMTYSSPILQSSPWNKMVVIPESYSNPEDQSDNRILGFRLPDRTEQTGYYRGTFGDLIREFKTLFNLRVDIVNDNFSLILDKAPTAGSFQLPDHYKPQFETNSNEVISNYLLSFQHDSVEKQTVDNWTGNNVQVILEPKVVNNSSMKLMKGLQSKNVNLARASRKKELTIPERVADSNLNVVGAVISALVNVANAVIDTVNAAIKVINKLAKALRVVGIKINNELDPVPKMVDPALGQLIDGRINMMLLETDIITVPKVALVNLYSDEKATRLSEDNDTHLNAKYIYENFHKGSSFAPGNDTRQRFIYRFEDVEMTLEDVQLVMQEGAARLPNGKVVEVVSCSWNPSTQLAKFVVEEQRIYTNNIKEVILEPTGH